jgi:hypothetical protein
MAAAAFQDDFRHSCGIVRSGDYPLPMSQIDSSSAFNSAAYLIHVTGFIDPAPASAYPNDALSDLD